MKIPFYAASFVLAVNFFLVDIIGAKIEGLQDIDNRAGSASFMGFSINELHEDLYSPELILKEKFGTKEETNIVLAKLVIFYDVGEGEAPLKKEFPLNTFYPGEVKPFVFDSGLDRSHIKRVCGTDYAYEGDLPKYSKILEEFKRNTLTDHLPLKILNLKPSYKCVCESEPVNYEDEVEAVTGTIKKAISDADDLFLEAQKDLDTLMRRLNAEVSDLESIMIDVRNWKPKLKGVINVKEAFGPLVSLLWHSEPRVLMYLKEKNVSSQLTSWERLGFIPKRIKAISLHLHSSNNSCPSCRIQLVGASYRWLYKDLVTHFTTEENTPMFHMIVSWFDEYKDSESFQNNVEHKEINESNIATFSDISSEGSTKPVVSFVRLSKPAPPNTGHEHVGAEGASSAAAAASVGK